MLPFVSFFNSEISFAEEGFQVAETVNQPPLIQFGRWPASLAAVAPFVHTRRARARESADVVVIGSGLSGLNAAWILSEAGADVLVLGRQHRIGGRVWSADEKWVTNAGEVPIELGASQVGPSYARVPVRHRPP